MKRTTEEYERQWSAYHYMVTHLMNLDLKCNITRVELPFEIDEKISHIDNNEDLNNLENDTYAISKAHLLMKIKSSIIDDLDDINNINLDNLHLEVKDDDIIDKDILNKKPKVVELDDEFYVSAQLYGNNQPMHDIPINTTSISKYDLLHNSLNWNHLISFPIKIQDLTENSKLVLNIYSMHNNELVGGTSMNLFTKEGTLKSGKQKLWLYLNVEGDGRVLTSTYGELYNKLYDKDYSFQYEKKLEEYFNNPQESRIDWLDQLLLTQLRTKMGDLSIKPIDSLSYYFLNDKENILRRNIFLIIELPRFDTPVLYTEKLYSHVAPSAPRVTRQILLTNEQKEKLKKYKDYQLKKNELINNNNNNNNNNNEIKDDNILNENYNEEYDDLRETFDGMNEDDETIEEDIIIFEKMQPDLQLEMNLPFFGELITVFSEWEEEDNPAEKKYLKLTRYTFRELIDPNLRPNKDEAAIINNIINDTSDDLNSQEKDILWKFRYCLTDNKKALTKFLISVDWSREQEINQVKELLKKWVPIDTADALKLLGKGHSYQHSVVRTYAVNILRLASDEDLLLYLLQLVQALRFEPDLQEEEITNDTINENNDTNSSNNINKNINKFNQISPLGRFLIERAIKSETLANYLFWYLRVETEDTSHGQLFSNLLRTFLSELNSKPETKGIYNIIRLQESLIRKISRCQTTARKEPGKKKEKEEKFRELLNQQCVNMFAEHDNAIVPFPLDPSILVNGLIPDTAIMFKSALYPSVVEFKRMDLIEKYTNKDSFNTRNSNHKDDDDNNNNNNNNNDNNNDNNDDDNDDENNDNINSKKKLKQKLGFDYDLNDKNKLEEDDKYYNSYKVVFKNGDDMRQDQLMIQMIMLMDRLLKQINLDLCLTPYRILAVGKKDGLMEFVQNSKCVSAVLSENKGSILEWMRKLHPDPNTKMGVKNDVLDRFIKSTAGYCVITYILGIGDRHLDNIMLRSTGQLFHIDFGFVFGRDPKPLPPPFRLTNEMVAAMGEDGFAIFKRTCFSAYKWLRKHAALIINLLGLMVDAGIEDLSNDPTGVLNIVAERFRLDISDEEAEDFFNGLIKKSRNALAPKLMEKFHQIAVAAR